MASECDTRWYGHVGQIGIDKVQKELLHIEETSTFCALSFRDKSMQSRESWYFQNAVDESHRNGWDQKPVSMESGLIIVGLLRSCWCTRNLIQLLSLTLSISSDCISVSKHSHKRRYSLLQTRKLDTCQLSNYRNIGTRRYLLPFKDYFVWSEWLSRYAMQLINLTQRLA